MLFRSVIRILREYYDAVGAAATECGGTIKDQAGDGVLILVGAPIAYADHAHRALELARKIRERGVEITARWSDQDLSLGVGVGVASGFVTVGVIGAASRYSAADAFRAQYRLAELQARIAPLWDSFDALLVPTAPTVFTREAVREAPVERNSAMGLYTNFVNLLDLAALAVPFCLREDRLPFGVTLIGSAGSEAALCEFGERLHAASGMTLGATGAALHFDAPQATSTLAASEIAIAVVGAHLSGEPLNHQLTERGGRLLRATRTAPCYRLYALPGGPPARPGMVRDSDGQSIELEVWALDAAAFGSFTAAIPPPLAIGTVALEDGSSVKGFLCETHATREARDISSFGGWRAWLRSQRPSGAAES